jgi:hypothetical protein
MPEVLAEFASPITDSNGRAYRAQACGDVMSDGLWHGWIEFAPLDGGAPLRSPRETTQPNRVDAAYWASGLTQVYYEGALTRALRPVTVKTPPAEPLFDGPAVERPVNTSTAGNRAILDPFSVYEKGGPLLRQELSALSAWHLVNIMVSFNLSAQPQAELNQLPHATLVELIVTAVRDHALTQ